MIFALILGMLNAYILGNLNGAVLVSALMGDDIRNHGSGNAGLTNFIRNYGRGKALQVIAVDAGKAVLACLVAGVLLAPYGLSLEGRMLGGLLAILGHTFPILLGFRGGKGILSGFTVAFCVDWRIAVLVLTVFILVYLCSHYVSLASLLASASFCLGFILFHHGNPAMMLMGCALGLVAIFMHRSNLVRLLKGEEKKTNLLSKGKQL